MPDSKDREVRPLPEAEALYRRWLTHLDTEFKNQQSPERRAEVVRDELYQIYLARPRGGSKPRKSLDSEMAIYVLGESLDVRNVAMGPEFPADLDLERYAPRRPLIWFWRMFDRSPLGLNVWLGFRFRCMLGRHIFKKLGAGVKIYQDVRFDYGYDLTIEDNCTIGRGAVLEDRAGLVIRQGTDVAPGATFSRGDQS